MKEYTLKEFSKLVGFKYSTFLHHKKTKYPEINKYFYRRKVNGYWYYFISVDDAEIVKKYIEEKEKKEEDTTALWTETALECYERNCICLPTCSSWEYCNRIEKHLGHKPIKQKVIELVRKYGKPIRRD